MVKKAKTAPTGLQSPKAFALQYEGLLTQGLERAPDLHITDKNTEELEQALFDELEKEELDRGDLVKLSALAYTLALVDVLNGDDDEESEEEDGHG